MDAKHCGLKSQIDLHYKSFGKANVTLLEFCLLGSEKQTAWLLKFCKLLGRRCLYNRLAEYLLFRLAGKFLAGTIRSVDLYLNFLRNELLHSALSQQFSRSSSVFNFGVEANRQNHFKNETADQKRSIYKQIA